ncbi:DUF397 domain-containing protein [Streptomyces sp. NPDC056347]|uniref:DUF397 domain-containing protein n=1 Tax=Streptomyces sp. NPDC056347 TaxID=3345790 RepID=UPI0035D7F860
MSSTHGPRPDQWVKSTYSDGNGGQCIEWAPEHAAATGDYLVRDSKDPEGPHLSLTANQWAGLVAFARKNG